MLIQVFAGVILANIVTVSFLYNMRAMEKDGPNLVNIGASLFIFLVVGLTGLAILP